ncbi:MAG: hypothetical protein ACXVB9_02220 [Bdellovibrionota bacterium]
MRIFLLLFFVSLPAFACEEQSLIHFTSHGSEVSSELIGAADPCDSFGGNLVHTPLHQLYLYVNFNIPGTIDLDSVDEAFALAPAQGQQHDWFQSVKLAVVDKGWIKRIYNDDREAVLNLGNDTLFISEVVVAEGRFGSLMKSFYSSH